MSGFTLVRFDGSDRAWDETIRQLPCAHPLQTAAWGNFKRRNTGWQPEKLIWRASDGTTCAAAMVLVKRVGILRMLYAPKAPLLDYTDHELLEQVLSDLECLARRHFALQLKIDPDVVQHTGEPKTDSWRDDPNGAAVVALLRQRGWRFSPEQVQFKNTVLIDLRRSEDELLAAMTQNKRRKVRYGVRHGVTIRTATPEDLPAMVALYLETGRRNNFLTRPAEYYLDEWRSLMAEGLAHAFIAEVNGQMAAHVVLLAFGQKCLYFNGASTSDNELRKLMPADALQWEAIRWAKAHGFTIYDMWGAPTHFDQSDPLWNVWLFKRDYGGMLTWHIGAWDYAPLPLLYWLYMRAMPRLRAWLRRRRSAQP
ncbi:MAG: peptidoglycan bridge formation glycyltransferase FemA/FemB family protein [Anaerolineae bacterium]|nr:peptidoglycan bridge formation glycyltransferase FemA/FemB family protein [Anaerolineae bacterium]